MKEFLLIVSVLLMASCNKKVTVNDNGSSYEAVAKQALDVPTVDLVENSQHDYVLATYLADAVVPGRQPLKFVIVKLADNRVVTKQSVLNGSVKWIDDYHLEIVSPPGVLQSDQETIADYTYLFNVKTGKKKKVAPKKSN